MANEIQDAPNTVPGAVADWENELNLRELSMKGYDGISLTEWAAGDEDKPKIAAGSVIEIDGAIAKFTNETALTDEGGLADGWCYIKFVVSGSDVVPTLTNTFGTWDTAKQGFYTAGNRFSLHTFYRSGAVTKIFTEKDIMKLPDAIMGYRYYTKLYTGTVAGGPSYLISFTDSKYNTSQIISVFDRIVYTFGSDYYISGVSSGFVSLGLVAGTVDYYNYTGEADLNGKAFQTNITYKITL